MTKKTTREKFTKEFKADAVNLVIEQGYRCSEVGRRLGVGSSNVSRWVREFKSEQEEVSEGGVSRRGLETELAKEALTMAYWRRKPQSGLLHHSDRGSQYASDIYQKQLKEYHMVPSMSRKGDCWDNSPMERFFRSLKSERLSFCKFHTRHEARTEILDYISFYNSSRLHSSLGYLSPMDFEMNNILNVA